ncbi:Cytosine/adenosine deaminase [Mariniphaga anaerophila]|uniref:Cytosine/adenosine deaminase n=1 Tax=Mariniphaga anaerophila TaxID=1484053 RepID=A0A1M5CE25_9BACT|nr:amidohydrolase family protein [Mariniphaga anaerophila]SHF52857.1 Cytosine/adenosine deaminase [Mariniphaga anaerophila]
MRKISASYIFPGTRPPLKNGILICEDDGTVKNVIDTGGVLREQAGLEQYSGVLVPGFVNAHCHLELSHLKNKITKGTGLGGFLRGINKLRNSEEADVQQAMANADFKMKHAGIVAVGDISNSTVSIATKHASNIYYHTFVEAFGIQPSRAEKAFSIAEQVESAFREAGLVATITPHSPYSVSELLFKKISKKALSENIILSVHNQESLAEKHFFEDRKGAIAEHFSDMPGVDITHWRPTGKSSLDFTLSFTPKENQLLLVHNTFTTEEDLQILRKQRTPENTFWVLCPNSNLHIEKKLPPVSLFQNEKINICLGTDSLASNCALSVLDEMVTLQEHFREITLQELVMWGCVNGARALGVSERFGSFEPGKKPGINLITGLDLRTMRLSAKSKVKVLR